MNSWRLLAVRLGVLVDVAFYWKVEELRFGDENENENG